MTYLYTGDLPLETTTTTGTGAVTLAGAVTGHQTFAQSGAANGDTTEIMIRAVDANGIPTGAWERSIATYASAGPTLTRSTILASSNSGAAVSFSAGTKRVYRVATREHENLYRAYISGVTYNANAPKLNKWRAALGKVINGTAPARVLLLGDSTTLGYGGSGSAGYSGNSRAFGFIPKLAAALNTQLAPTRDGAFIGSGNTSTYPAFDTRVTATNWTPGTILDGSIGHSFFSVTNGGTLSFAPAVKFDNVQIWYAQAAGQGNATVNVDGGATLTTITGAGANSFASVSISGITLATHTLNIVKSGTSSLYILGIRTWDSTNPSIELFQAGWGGGFASDFDNAANPWDSLNQLTSLAPDLTIINLTINDAVNLTSPATYTSIMQTIITAALASGSVILTTGVPSAISQQTLANQQLIIDAAAALAIANNIPFVDQWRRFTSYEIANPLGMYTDTLHPNGAGYSDYARALLDVIKS